MKIVCISDTHNLHEKVQIPECDLLISAGDYSFFGKLEEIIKFHKWLHKQPARYVISVQGNHELWVEKNFDLAKAIANHHCPLVHFIEEGPVEIEGVRIWCSAITPHFCNWAYNRYPGEDIGKHWDKIPLDTEILVTHGPPQGILDLTLRGERVGSGQLATKIKELTRLKLHIFGHIHGGYGTEERFGVTYVNASLCDESYSLRNNPVLFNLKEKNNG